MVTHEIVVQKAVEIVLSSIYIPTFLKTSHGLATPVAKRGCYSALKQIAMEFKNCVWFINVNLNTCLHSIDLSK
jgi:hypothetical protein